jgi:hypothetical protein
MSDEDKSPLIKAATSEYTLLTYRTVTALCAVIITAYVIGTRDDVKGLSRELDAFRVAQIERLAKVEGQVGELRGSVEVHRKRLEGNDADIRSIWSRFYDLNSRTPTRGTP